MSKNKSHIYLNAIGQWVPVSEEFHKAYFHEIDLFRRRQIRRGFCKCTGPKWWLCDMDCGVCEFQCANSRYMENVAGITSDDGNRLLFHFTDGTVTERTWCNRSRSESWTDEMRQKARDRTKARNQKK